MVTVVSAQKLVRLISLLCPKSSSLLRLRCIQTHCEGNKEKKTTSVKPGVWVVTLCLPPRPDTNNLQSWIQEVCAQNSTGHFFNAPSCMKDVRVKWCWIDTDKQALATLSHTLTYSAATSWLVTALKLKRGMSHFSNRPSLINMKGEKLLRINVERRWKIQRPNLDAVVFLADRW